VPKEWLLNEAYIEKDGRRIVDAANNNLHIIGYSAPVDAVMDLADLQPHLHSVEASPDAIPYINSYYRPEWGFCISHRDRMAMEPGRYHVRIDSKLFDGSLTYGEIKIPGREKRELFFSTYVCHPNMANDQVSGIVVLMALAEWLSTRDNRYSTRIVFVPEMIGSAAYLSRHLREMRELIVAGLVVACVGDERAYGYMPSRHGNTLADRLIKEILRGKPNLQRFSYLWPNRGADERNYCMPGVDLPVASFFRSKYGTYPEYHTSLDDLSLITPCGLADSFDALKSFVEITEANVLFKTAAVGEPMLGKRGLYPAALTHHAGLEHEISLIMNLLAYADGTHDLLDLAEIIDAPAMECARVAKKLVDAGLLSGVGLAATPRHYLAVVPEC
jgi:aminopeptidase-like protein